MRKVKQLSLFLDNRPGVLSRVSRVLAQKKVSIIGISITDGHDHAIVRMVVDRPGTAIHCLGSAGVLVLENYVLMMNLNNRIGALSEVSKTLGAAGVNIEYAYCTADLKENAAKLIISVNETTKSLRVLKRLLNKGRRIKKRK